MAALFLTALIALIGVTAAGVLADSGLRWWSAFGKLRREMGTGMGAGTARALPTPRVSIDAACFHRVPARHREVRGRVSRAAA